MEIWLELIKQGGLAAIVLALLYILFTQKVREGKTLDALYQAQVDMKEVLSAEIRQICQAIGQAATDDKLHQQSVTANFQALAVIGAKVDSIKATVEKLT